MVRKCQFLFGVRQFLWFGILPKQAHWQRFCGAWWRLNGSGYLSKALTVLTTLDCGHGSPPNHIHFRIMLFTLCYRSSLLRRCSVCRSFGLFLCLVETDAALMACFNSFSKAADPEWRMSASVDEVKGKDKAYFEKTMGLGHG